MENLNSHDIEPEIIASEAIPEYKKEILNKLFELVNRKDPEHLQMLYSANEPENEMLQAFIEAQRNDADVAITYDEETEDQIDNDPIIQRLIAEKNEVVSNKIDFIEGNETNEKKKKIAQAIRLRSFQIYFYRKRDYLENNKKDLDYPSAS